MEAVVSGGVPHIFGDPISHGTMDALVTPTQWLCIDESMVFWRGHLIFCIYMKVKRHTYGIKTYMLTEPSGLALRFLVYTGSSDSDMGGVGHVDNDFSGAAPDNHRNKFWISFNSHNQTSSSLLRLRQSCQPQASSIEGEGNYARQDYLPLDHHLNSTGRFSYPCDPEGHTGRRLSPLAGLPKPGKLKGRSQTKSGPD
ncbi:hypothetical protein J437_LFUL015441 [Ladona fulva]|uniref:PiggyBac transposable element-derived protein domain-containing protein n=1 Tax=Ladona fulva TaxID=123851 RepID=A0A8K0KKL0_LADFU|nr:hypothetical protein J437_LFUL015441 [Ladona fulva]